jgi:6-phospho-beta-glucosidase
MAIGLIPTQGSLKTSSNMRQKNSSQRRSSGLVVAVIGSGSSYTPMIVRELVARRERLPVAELRLYDTDAERQAVVGGFCRRLAGGQSKLFTPRRLAAALDGADFVLSQFRVGGWRMRHEDIRLGTRHGLIGQETTGIGGFAKALRTIPATLHLCQAMRRHAARDAWLLNFTNPSGIVTETALKHGGVRSLGLCNGPYNLRRHVAEILQADMERVAPDYVGANHLGWLRSVWLDGRDVTDKVRRARLAARARNVPAPDRDPIFARLMSLPYNSYLDYYYYTESMFAKIRGAERTRAQEVARVEKRLFTRYADPKTSDIPEDLSKRGGQSYNLVAVNLIDAIVNNLDDIHIVNIQNGGALPGICDDAVIETTCRVDARGARALFRGPLAPQFRGLLQAVKAYEELTVAAGVHGDLDAALHALILHPLGPTASTASKLLAEMLKINAAWLPQFKPAAVRRFFRQ